MQLISFKYLGINEYAARIPNAICGVLIALTLYKNGKRIYSTNFGMIWATVYMSMLLPQFYHRSGLLEPWFCFFIYLSLYNLSRVLEARQERGEKFYRRKEIFSNLFYSVFAAVGAVLTKGIEGYLIVVLTYWLVFVLSTAKYGFGYSSILKWTAYLILFILIWIGIEYKWHGTDYLYSFFKYQIGELDIQKATWTSRISFPALILFLGCFPASALAFNSVKIRSYESNIQKIFRLTMISCLIIVLAISMFLKHKTAHFTVLAYFPISFLAAYSIRYVIEETKAISKRTYALLILGGLIWTACLTVVPLVKANLSLFQEYIHEDTLLLALSEHYEWEELEMIFGLSFFLILMSSITLLVFNRRRLGLMILVFGTMVISNSVLLYYVPKIEQITQGPQVGFVKNNSMEEAYYHYHNGRSYISNFYSDKALKNVLPFTKENIPQFKEPAIAHYLAIKTMDTMKIASFNKDLTFLYKQGIYSFYKLRK